LPKEDERMKIKFLTITTLILSVSIMLIGCGEEPSPPLPANVWETIPGDGESIAANGILTIKFDESPVEGTVKVNGTPAEGAGTKYSWRPVIALGEGVQTLEIIWENEDGSTGTHAIKLHVTQVDLTPPRIVSSRPENGEYVDPHYLNDSITITFDDNIDIGRTKPRIIYTNYIDYELEEIFGLVVKWSDDRKTLTLKNKIGGFGYGKYYYGSEVKVVIEGATDDAGNAADLEISFFTCREDMGLCVHPANLVGLWSFVCLPVGDVLRDFSGNGNDGRIKGNAKSGGNLKGWIFDGLNAMVEIPSSPTLNITQSITIIAQIKPHDVKGLIVGKEGAYGMALDEKGGIRWVIWGDEFVAKADIKKQEWYYIALVYDFAAKKRFVYLNGRLIAERETSVTMPVSNHPLTIGKWATLREAFNGSINGVVLWNAALTEAEIKKVWGAWWSPCSD